MFFGFLQTCDVNRVKPVLKEIAGELRNSPTVDSWYQTFQNRAQYRNSVYQVFCCPDLLQDPEIRSDFTDICATQRVFPEGPGAGLISLLFNNDARLRFPVEHSWKELGPHITPEVFETHLLDTLEDCVQKTEAQVDPGSLRLFCAGVAIIVQSVSKELIMKCICGAQNDPIKLAVNRISSTASYLPTLLRLFDALMVQLGFEFWDVVQPLTSSALIDTLFANGSFANFLRSAPQEASGEKLLVDMTRWMSSLVASVRPLSRATPAAPLLRLLLGDRRLPALSKGICLKEGMKLLSMTLSGVYSHPIEGEGGRMILRQTNELFDEYALLAVEIAVSSTVFNDQIMADHMGIAQKNAYNAMLLALQLDIKVMKTDFGLLSKKKPEIPHTETSIRILLWDTVCRSIPIDHVELAIDLLSIIYEFLGIGKSVHPKGIDTGSEADRRRHAFNRALDTLSRHFARIFQQISRFAPNKLKMVMEGEHSRVAIFVGVMFPPPKDVAFGAEDVLLSCYGVDSRESATHAMFDDNLAMALAAVTTICRTQAKSSVFDLMPAMIRFNLEVLDILCAPDTGVISNTNMENWMKTSFRVYWDIQWRVVGNIFKRCRRWSHTVEKGTMIEFTRDSIDYATELFRRFWTFEQAFRAKGPSDETTRPERETSWRVRLLQDPSKALDSIAALLTIQDMHLLSSSQELMCNILELLAKEDVDVEDEFVDNMRQIFFPELYSSTRTIPITNLVEAQKAQLIHALSAVRPDFVPPEGKCYGYLNTTQVHCFH